MTNEFLDKLIDFLNELDKDRAALDQCLSTLGSGMSPGLSPFPIIPLPREIRQINKAACYLTSGFLSVMYKYCSPSGVITWKPGSMRPPRTSNGITCPTRCDYSVTFCDRCVNAEVPGNLALGFGLGYWMSELPPKDVKTIGTWLSGAIARLAGSRDTPDDTGSIESGVDVGREARDSIRTQREANKSKKGKGKKTPEEQKREEREKLKSILCRHVRDLADTVPGVSMPCPPCPHS